MAERKRPRRTPERIVETSLSLFNELGEPHVTTADERVLPQGTAYITDVGMTGPHGGVIGMDRQGIIKKFLDGLPARFEVAEGDVQMNTVLIETDDDAPRNSAGRLRARSIERLRFCLDT